MAAMVAFSCAAYAANRGANRVFSDRPEMVSAVGSVVIGVCGNIWSRLGGGTAFTVMVTGVLFLVPVRYSRSRACTIGQRTDVIVVRSREWRWAHRELQLILARI